MWVILRKGNRTPWTPKGPPWCHFHWRLSCDMRNKEVHGQVLTVHHFIYHYSNRFWHSVCIQEVVVFMVECCTCQHHRQLTTIVRVIIPWCMISIPSMEPAWEPNQPVPVLPPDTETKDNLIMAQVWVIIYTQDSFCLYSREWKESIIQAILLYLDNMDGYTNIRPP